MNTGPDPRLTQIGDHGPLKRTSILPQSVHADHAMAGLGEDLAHGAAHPPGTPGDEGDPWFCHGATSDGLGGLGTARPRPIGGAECGPG